MNVWWRVKDVVVSGCLKVLEDAGEEFCCESETTGTFTIRLLTKSE